MADFDPDAYLAQTAQKPAQAFDPDAYLAHVAPTAISSTPALGQAGNFIGPKQEAMLHGAVEAIPFGQKATALGATGVLKLAKALGNAGIGPAYFKQLPDTSYDEQLARERGLLTTSEQEHPYITGGGKLLGGGLSMAAMAPLKAAQGAGALARVGTAAGNAGLYGAAHGAGQGDSGREALGNALVEGPTMALAGGGGQLLSEAAAPLGEKLLNAAGNLKVKSLRPTPTLAEKMEALPGGETAVGQELLKEGLGGATKKGTLQQVKAAMERAGSEVGDLATKYDQSGGKAVDLSDALAVGKQYAEKLAREPSTESAGNKLGELVGKYENIYAGKPVPAEQALVLKRALGKLAYGSGKQFEKSGDIVAGDFGKGVSQMERAVDSSLDSALGPEFESKNLTFRQLMAANQAAKRVAGRQTSKHAFGLQDILLGAAAAPLGMSHGPAGVGLSGLAAAGASKLASAYGPQVAARMLYGAGRGAEMLPSLLARAPMLPSVTAGSLAEPLVPALLPRFAEQPQAEQNQALIAALRGNRVP